MNEPTQEQLRTFWEWCGLKQDGGFWHDPTGKQLTEETPPPDLNNLFKWAVPKLVGKGIYAVEFLYDKDGIRCFLSPLSNWTRDKGPAPALFWAIWRGIQ